MNLDFSFVIPVYNRPDEVRELLESFKGLDYSGAYEIVIVEDGSSISSEEIVADFKNALDISYHFKPNTGPGDSRNFGMKKAKGNYFIILDSDVILPSNYLSTVANFLRSNFYDCFGGADAAHESFSDLQKAINHVMTSFFTTGGIRGSEKSLTDFEPRSFNMGISKEAFEKTGGFGKIHPGEDPDLSHRIKNSGFKTTFIPKAYVYHKRRISWKKFLAQVKKFGMVRPILSKWHPASVRITYWFPSMFVLFVIASILTSVLLSWICCIPLIGYLILIFMEASIKNRSLSIGILAVIAVFVQFFGYGIGFLKSTFYIRLLNKDPEKQFPELFFN